MARKQAIHGAMFGFIRIRNLNLMYSYLPLIAGPRQLNCACSRQLNRRTRAGRRAWSLESAWPWPSLRHRQVLRPAGSQPAPASPCRRGSRSGAQRRPPHATASPCLHLPPSAAARCATRQRSSLRRWGSRARGNGRRARASGQAGGLWHFRVSHPQSGFVILPL